MLIINSYNRIKFSFLNFSFFVTMKIGKFFSKIAFSNNYLKILHNIVNNLYIKGYAIVPNYYTSDEVENLNQLVNQILDDIKDTKEDDRYLERVEGQVKVKHIQSKYLQLRRYSTELLFTFISLFFYGRPKIPSVLCTVTHDGSFLHSSVPGACMQPIAGESHVDGYRHYLKAIIFLEDVNIENGPTAIIKGSYRNKKLLPTFLKLMRKKGEVVDIPSDISEELKKNNPPQYLTGKKGDLILIDTCNIHWASALNKGCRKLLWFYF